VSFKKYEYTANKYIIEKSTLLCPKATATEQQILDIELIILLLKSFVKILIKPNKKMIIAKKYIAQ
jgi:hypothetical protein